jgi:hypothetical protein
MPLSMITLRRPRPDPAAGLVAHHLAQAAPACRRSSRGRLPKRPARV